MVVVPRLFLQLETQFRLGRPGAGAYLEPGGRRAVLYRLPASDAGHCAIPPAVDRVDPLHAPPRIVRAQHLGAPTSSPARIASVVPAVGTERARSPTSTATNVICPCGDPNQFMKFDQGDPIDVAAAPEGSESDIGLLLA